MAAGEGLLGVDDDTRGGLREQQLEDKKVSSGSKGGYGSLE